MQGETGRKGRHCFSAQFEEPPAFAVRADGLSADCLRRNGLADGCGRPDAPRLSSCRAGRQGWTKQHRLPGRHRVTPWKKNQHRRGDKVWTAELYDRSDHSRYLLIVSIQVGCRIKVVPRRCPNVPIVIQL